MARYLIVANLTSESPALRQRVQGIVEADPDAEFTVLVPTYPLPPWLNVLSASQDRPIRLGRRRAQRARRRLEAVGAHITAVRLSLHEPLVAIEQELHGGRYDGVIVSTLPHRLSQWLHLDVVHRVERSHPELAVTHVVAPASLYEEVIAEDLGALPRVP